MRKLPPIPANLPTKISAPWLTENQLRLYLPPLIESGWTLGWNKELCTFYLRGNFPAKRCKRALNLMDAIRTVAMEENVCFPQIAAFVLVTFSSTTPTNLVGLRLMSSSMSLRTLLPQTSSETQPQIHILGLPSEMFVLRCYCRITTAKTSVK